LASPEQETAIEQLPPAMVTKDDGEEFNDGETPFVKVKSTPQQPTVAWLLAQSPV